MYFNYLVKQNYYKSKKKKKKKKIKVFESKLNKQAIITQGMSY